jgi:hypothetical protein
MRKHFTSGSAIITAGFPSYFGAFASMSPKVLETYLFKFLINFTESLPGRTLKGPVKIWPHIEFFDWKGEAFAKVCVLKQIQINFKY